MMDIMVQQLFQLRLTMKQQEMVTPRFGNRHFPSLPFFLCTGAGSWEFCYLLCNLCVLVWNGAIFEALCNSMLFLVCRLSDGLLKIVKLHAKVGFERRWLFLLLLLPIPMFHHNIVKFVVFRNLIHSKLINKSCVFFGSLGWFISWIKIMGIDKHGELFFLGELGICTTTWIKPNQVESTWAGASKSSAASEFFSIFHNSLLCGGGVVVPYLFP
jgi:hypothetical protein